MQLKQVELQKKQIELDETYRELQLKETELLNSSRQVRSIFCVKVTHISQLYTLKLVPSSHKRGPAMDCPSNPHFGPDLLAIIKFLLNDGTLIRQVFQIRILLNLLSS